MIHKKNDCVLNLKSFALNLVQQESRGGHISKSSVFLDTIVVLIECNTLKSLKKSIDHIKQYRTVKKYFAINFDEYGDSDVVQLKCWLIGRVHAISFLLGCESRTERKDAQLLFLTQFLTILCNKTPLDRHQSSKDQLIEMFN